MARRIQLKEKAACRGLLGHKKPAIYWNDEAAGIAGVGITQITSRVAQELIELIATILFSKRRRSPRAHPAAALQDNQRSTAMSQRTFGRGEGMSFNIVKGLGALKLRVSELLRPNGKALDRAGMARGDGGSGRVGLTAVTVTISPFASFFPILAEAFALS